MELSWWNLIPSHFDGIAIELGSFPVHWYGLMYLFAFATCYVVITKTNKKENIGLSKEQIDNFFTRYNNKQRKVSAGIILIPKGRPPKDYVVREEDKVAEPVNPSSVH